MNANTNRPIANDWILDWGDSKLIKIESFVSIRSEISARGENRWNSEQFQKKIVIKESSKGLEGDLPLEERYSWIKKVYNSKNLDNPIVALLFLFEKMEDLLEAKRFKLIDYIFQNLEFDKMIPDTLVGMLRIVSPAKKLNDAPLILTVCCCLLIRCISIRWRC